MLKKLIVERFKSIRAATIELGRVNLFIGGNGAGKSNIIEAIGVLSASIDRGLGDTDLSRKGIRITPPELMKSAFKNEKLPRTLQLTANLTGDVEYRINLTGREEDPLLAFFSERCMHGQTQIFGRGPNGARVLGESIHGSLDRHRGMWDQVRTPFLKFPNTVERSLQRLSQYVIYAPQTDFLRGLTPGKVDTPPIGLHGEGLKHAVRGLAQQLHDARSRKSPALKRKNRAIELARLPQWVSTVAVTGIDRTLTSRALPEQGDDVLYFLDRYMHSSRQKVSAYDSSEGTLFLLFVGILLAHDDSPQVFSLDNVDGSLNPRMTRALLETIVDITKESSAEGLSGPNQVFLTSHNPTSLDAFDLFDDDQRVFVVERNQSGHTTVTRLRPRPEMTREEWQQATNGRNLSQLWLDGEIRGALGQDL